MTHDEMQRELDALKLGFERLQRAHDDASALTRTLWSMAHGARSMSEAAGRAALVLAAVQTAMQEDGR